MAVQEILESIEKLTLIEAAELVKAMEEKFGVSAAAPVAVAAAPAAGGAAPAAADGDSEVSIVLASAGANKIAVLKEVRTITGLGLKEAKALVDECPKPIKEGATKENALAMSVFSGSLQALVETAMGNVAGVLGKNAVGAGAKKAITEKVTGNLFKRLHYDKTFANLALKMGSEYVKENFEEGMEEVIQDLISKGTHALSAELEEYDIEPMTAESVAKDAWENFKGGILGSLVLGIGSTAYNTSATIKDYSAVKEAASNIPSDEAYEKIVSESPVFKGMETEERTELIKKIREDNRGKLDESIQKHGPILTLVRLGEQACDHPSLTGSKQ